MLELLSQYGYWGIFFFLVLGIVGLPLPDEIMMTFIGYLASTGQLELVLTFVSALAGSICGITISYLLGGRLGYPFLRRYGNKMFINRRRLRMTQFLFRKYGNWVLFFGYFIPGVRHITAYVAGISHMPWTRFAAYAYAGGLFWCSTFIGLGYLVGANWEQTFTTLHHYGELSLWVLVPLLLVALAWFFYNHHQRRYNSIRK
ncbi:membrane protein DedA, SNARE-associated domain [Marininema halotolerans]|uniref:Membrane protein DedA, SNARE-associated domain n=2 Tax=Marininema halotolerans TaxID=1155944 RepID=A0A1I6SXA1_9BACL|nr:membrane protein DedA, SNARE-associated domain [Marininema halotolerans]